jgi:hypothetical protein
MRANALVIIGAVIALLGLAALVMPVITTQDTKDLARIGDLKVQATESTPHVVPPALSIGALAIGLAVLGIGAYRRR